MAKYFLGSVGKAEAFRRNADGELELAFVSKTLTDSGLNISTTKDDIRAGEGAPIQFSFYHDPSVEITLTDVLFKTDYVRAQLGAAFDKVPQSYITENVTFTQGAATLTKEVLPLPFPCGSEEYVAWAAKKGSDEWTVCSVGGDHKSLTLAGATGEYCVRFLSLDDRAKVAEITSTIIPEELFLIITAPIFAGDACSASKGRAAGSIQFEVPRFVLNGAQEFAMNMSSNQPMSLAGTALATESQECDANGGKLLRIIEVINDRKWYDDLKDLIVDEDSAVVGQEPIVYGWKKDNTLVRAVNSDLTFNPALSGTGTLAASGSTTVARGSASATFTVAASD